jgi:hypothetical protein
MKISHYPMEDNIYLALAWSQIKTKNTEAFSYFVLRLPVHEISSPRCTKHTISITSIVAVDLQPKAPPFVLHTGDIFSLT